MDSTAGVEKLMEPLPREPLLAKVEFYLNMLTAEHWRKLKSGLTDNEVIDIISELSVEIIQIIARCIKKLSHDNRLKESKSSQCSPQSPRSSSGSEESGMSKDEVVSLLEDTIPTVFKEVMGVPSHVYCGSTEELTKLVATEAIEVVNSEHSESCGTGGGERKGSKPQLFKAVTDGPKKLVNQVVIMLKNLAAKMTRKFGSRETPKTGGESTQPDQGLVIPFEEDEPEDASSTSISRGTPEFIKEMLVKEASPMTSMRAADISEEECQMIMSTTSKTADVAASSIYDCVMEELNLQTDSASTSEPGSEVGMICRKRVAREMMSFFFHTFAIDSLLKLALALKCELASVQQKQGDRMLLARSLDCLVEDMIRRVKGEEMGRSTNEVCLYQKILDDISSGRYEITAKQIGDVISHHLYPGEGGRLERLQNRNRIQLEVESLIQVLYDWLDQQSQLYVQQQDLASATFEKLQLSLPMDTKGLLTEEMNSLESVIEPAPASITDEPAIGDEADKDGGKTATFLPKEWDREWCEFTVKALVDVIMENTSHLLTPIVQVLSDMLWAKMADSDIAVQPSIKYVKKAIKAAKKDLFKMSEVGALQILLLLENEHFYNIVTETLVRHLVKQKKKSGIKAFFKSVFKAVAKPVTALFRTAAD